MLKALTNFLIARHRMALIVALVSSAPMLYWSTLLFADVRADLKELLPKSAPSVLTLRELERRFGGFSQLSIVVTSPDADANRRFSDDLVAKLEQAPQIRSIRNKLGEEKKFFEPRRHLYVDLEDLEEIEERIEDAIHDAKVAANPLFVDLSDTSTKVTLDFSDIEEKYEGELSLAKRFPNDYFESKDKTELAVILRQRGLAFGLERNQALVALVEGTVAELNPASYHPDLVVGLGGDVKNLIEETTSLVEDLVLASVVVAILLALVVVGYYRRLRSMLLIAIPLYVGCVWTFGLSHFLVGYLNASTAFLGPIVPGNGINFGLILLARYIEERRAGTPVDRAIHTAVEFTAKATITAAVAASIAYGSLMVTDFLGFKHFGVIGGIGMVLCWIATFVVLPPLIVFVERRWPMDPSKERFKLYESGRLAALPARWVGRHARPLAWFGLVTGLAAVVVTVLFLKDPLEKDFEKLRNTGAHEKGAAYWEKKVDKIFGRYLAPQVIIAEKKSDVPQIVAALEKVIDEQGDNSPVSDVDALSTLVPKNQEDKIEVLERIRELLNDDLIAQLDDDQAEIAKQQRPPADLEPFGEQDLPEGIRADFRELDGREGLVVLVLPNLKLNLYHADEIRRVAEVLRDIPLSDGRRVESSGSFVIYTDMVEAVSIDGPRATIYSFLGVLILCALVFVRPRRVFFVVTPLLLGVAWLFALLAIYDLKINFLNFIALPITFGIGVDYAVNIFSRHLIEKESAPPPKAIERAVASTGGAVVLCSLTTIIGYGSLLLARNGALISFGKVAILGELTCLIAAIIVMPAWIARWDR
ncbi:MAG: MMPL family transporter [Deltaproteobacteria bacterium]